MKDNYYDQNLNAQKLYQVYQSKYCGVSQYLEAEISYVKNHLQGTEQILELGAGYGRIMKELAPFCRSIVGIDISRENVEFGREYLKEMENAQLLIMDAHHIQLEASFDVILCLQNGLSAMKVFPDVGYPGHRADPRRRGGHGGAQPRAANGAQPARSGEKGVCRRDGNFSGGRQGHADQKQL